MLRKRIVIIVTLGSLMFLVFFFLNTKLILHYGVKIKFNNLSEKPKLHHNLKYILLWTNPNKYPFIYFGEGTTVFKEKKCRWSNCYVTGNRFLLGSYTKFDVILFNGPQLPNNFDHGDLPKERDAQQKFVYTNIEASSNYPICSKIWDRYFNWTWTYKLNSDSVWGYFLIKDSRGHVIGPKENMYWMRKEDMDPIDDDLKLRLNSKTKAVAWFVSNCDTQSQREKFVAEVLRHLKVYNVNVDIFGECGSFKCPKDIMERCLTMLEKYYYFYFAFENAVSEDYVSEKILHAVKHNTVPIVFGGANYNRFMPPGSYVNALELGTVKLAKTIYTLITNKTKYYQMFKWKKYYSYYFRQESPETDDYCHFCTIINNKTLMNTVSVYDKFSEWWSDKNDCTNIPMDSDVFPWDNIQ